MKLMLTMVSQERISEVLTVNGAKSARDDDTVFFNVDMRAFGEKYIGDILCVSVVMESADADLTAQVAEANSNVAMAYNLGRHHESMRMSESNRRPFDYDNACKEARSLGAILYRYGQEAKAKEVE